MYVLCFSILQFLDPVSVFTVYSKEDITEIMIVNLSDSLRRCAVDSNIDLYHSTEDIPDWNQWTEDQIKKCCDNGGYILMLCGKTMSEHLLSTENVKMEMHAGFIRRLTL